MDSGPSNDELRAFIQAMLSNLDRRLREPEVIDEAIEQHRQTWEGLYRASLGLDVAQRPPGTGDP